jgi:hypothetical protein
MVLGLGIILHWHHQYKRGNNPKLRRNWFHAKGTKIIKMSRKGKTASPKATLLKIFAPFA